MFACVSASEEGGVPSALTPKSHLHWGSYSWWRGARFCSTPPVSCFSPSSSNPLSCAPPLALPCLSPSLSLPLHLLQHSLSETSLDSSEEAHLRDHAKLDLFLCGQEKRRCLIWSSLMQNFTSFPLSQKAGALLRGSCLEFCEWFFGDSSLVKDYQSESSKHILLWSGFHSCAVYLDTPSYSTHDRWLYSCWQKQKERNWRSIHKDLNTHSTCRVTLHGVQQQQ